MLSCPLIVVSACHCNDQFPKIKSIRNSQKAFCKSIFLIRRFWKYKDDPRGLWHFLTSYMKRIGNADVKLYFNHNQDFSWWELLGEHTREAGVFSRHCFIRHSSVEPAVLLSAMYILKGTDLLPYSVLCKAFLWRQATWSFSEQPSYSSHITLCLALLSASQWELPPPQAGASGPIAKGPINQWLCPRHAQHLHQQITFLTKKERDQMAIKRLEPNLDPQRTVPQLLTSGGNGPEGRCSIWANAAAVDPGSSRSRITWGGFKEAPYPGLIPETLG